MTSNHFNPSILAPQIQTSLFVYETIERNNTFSALRMTAATPRNTRPKQTQAIRSIGYPTIGTLL